MSQFLVAYRELLGNPTSATAIMQLHVLMTGSPAVDGVEDAKATVKSMAESLAVVLAG